MSELAVPSGTTVEEHDLVTDGDILIGGQSTVEFGLRGRTVALGERVSVGNDIEADGDCRIDTWGSVDGNVLVGEDAYLGERVTINGQLMVSGDLDIGDDVTIEEGFEANGWIVIRNPIPTIVFYFIVISQLLRAGETDAADELAAALSEGEDVRDPLLIPRAASVSDDAWRVSTPATVGDDCRIHGNLRAESVEMGDRNEVFGSLRARSDVTVGEKSVIHGDVTTRDGTVTIEAGAHIRGDVSARDLIVHEGAEVDGLLRARGEMKLVQRTDDNIDDEPTSNEVRSGAGDPDEYAESKASAVDTESEDTTEDTGTEESIDDSETEESIDDSETEESIDDSETKVTVDNTHSNESTGAMKAVDSDEGATVDGTATVEPEHAEIQPVAVDNTQSDDGTQDSPAADSNPEDAAEKTAGSE